MYTPWLSTISSSLNSTHEESRSLHHEPRPIMMNNLKRHENDSFDSTSASALGVKIAVPLFVTLISLLVLFAMKSLYLKQRRLRDIHQTSDLAVEHEEANQGVVKNPESLINCNVMKDRGTTFVSAKCDTRRNTHSGFFVGLLGSPDWETNMQRHMADHRWRQLGENRNRHTWHPSTTPISPRSFSSERVSQTSPSIPSPQFDRFECPSIEDIQQGYLQRQQSSSMCTAHSFKTGMGGSKKKRGSLGVVFRSTGNLPVALPRNVGNNSGRRRMSDRISHTPEITISIADDANPQNSSILLPSNSFRLESDLPTAHVKNYRAVSPCPSHSSFLSLASTTHSRSSVIDCDLDNMDNSAEGISSLQYPFEAHLQS